MTKTLVDSRVLVTLWLTILCYNPLLVWLLKLSTEHHHHQFWQEFKMFTRSNNKTRPFSPRVLCLMLKIRRRETKILGDFGVELGQTLFSGGGERKKWCLSCFDR